MGPMATAQPTALQRTLSLDEAAEFLKVMHKQTVRRDPKREARQGIAVLGASARRGGRKALPTRP